MTRSHRHWWRSALLAGAVYGLTFGSHAFAADLPTRDGAELAGSRTISADAAFQSLGVLTAKAGSSSYAVRKQAIVELQAAELSADATTKVNRILNNLAMFRRMPTLTFEADPDVYNYFLRNPDVTVATWRAMEISKFQLTSVGAGCYNADAGDGSVGRIELLRQTPTETVIHCDGAFKSPLLPKPITARSVMRLQTSFTKEADGRVVATHSGDVFVEFPSQAVETVARVISPVSHSIADRNFKQISLYVHLMTQAMAKHPGWIENIGNKLDGVTGAQRQQFLEVSARSHVIARKRLAAQSGKPLQLDEILSPFRVSEPAVLSPVVIRPTGATSRD
jgi:hypothetical protein